MTNRSPPFSALTERLSGPRSRAWNVTDHAYEMERAGRDIIHLGVGDPDFDTPPDITTAAVAALHAGRTHYSPAAGEPALRNAIAASYQRDFSQSVASAQVTVFPGAQCALFGTLLCLAGPGDEVILLEPFYATYEGVACGGGANVIRVPMNAKNGFGPDIDAIKERLSERTRVLIVNSPGNPSGALIDDSTWQALVALCTRQNIWLVSDEVYGNLVFEGRRRSALSYSDAGANIVAISSVSKSHAMTGWRLGWAVAPPELATHLARLVQCLFFGVNQFTQDAAAHALCKPSTEVAVMRREFRDRRNAFCDALASIDGIRVHRPNGGMFAMVDVSETGLDGEQFATRLLDHGGIAVVPGIAFGDSVANYIRIGYLIDTPRLLTAAERIKSFVHSLSC